MQVNYQLTAIDFLDGMRAYRRMRTWTRWTYRLGYVILISTALLVLAFLVIGRTGANDLVPLVGVEVLWVFLLWLSPYLSARSQFRGSPSARSAKMLEVSGAGLSFQSAHGTSQMLWSVFANWVEGKQVFALFMGPKAFIAVPKRAFDREQLEEFRELLRQNIRTK